MSEVKLVHATLGAERLIVKMARVSNPRNEDNWETGPKLIRYLIDHDHWSPFEMASMCVRIETERDISAQIIRHRSFSFQEYCLAGDARIFIESESGVVQRIPIAELYKKWQSPRFKTRWARAYDTNLERFINAPIKSVYSSGQKPVYEYKIDYKGTERTLKCTREHRVLTKERGFVPFGVASDEGLTIALNGEPAVALPYQDAEVLRANAWMGSTRFAKEYGIAEVTARKWFRHYGITPYKLGQARACRIDHPFSSRLSSFMKWARENIRSAHCEFCGHDGSKSRLEMSHIQAHDGDPVLAFDASNLRTLCAKCHRAHDMTIQNKSYGWTLNMTAKWGRITSETFLGIQETFDIEMDHETHNFVADGVVVHNSGRYSPMDRPELPALRTQAQKNRQSSVEALDPEIEKHFTRMSASLLANVYLTYQEMLAAGVARECARRILPLCTPTTLYMHGTLRSWMTYIKLRTLPDTQLEHREIAEACKAIFVSEFPTIAEAYFG